MQTNVDKKSYFTPHGALGTVCSHLVSGLISLQVISLHCRLNVYFTTMLTSVAKTNVSKDYVTTD
jgi:hypothetical protein